MAIEKEETKVEEEKPKKAKKPKKSSKEVANDTKKGFKKLYADFKKFISRGNVVDLAIGVVIGGAFGAVVTAVTNIFLSVCTWSVPGGLSGLVTVLPAVNDNQKGMPAIGQSFAAVDLNSYAKTVAINEHGVEAVESNAALIDNAKNMITKNYTLRGSTYFFNGSAIIDWGALLNAALTFLIIAITLFIIIKVIQGLAAKKEQLALATQEAYYKKHPEERPVPPEPGKPAPTETELLSQILQTLKEQKAETKLDTK